MPEQFLARSSATPAQSSDPCEARTRLTLAELRGLELLQSVDIETVEPLLRDGEVRALSPGEVLIEAGAPNRHLYLLLSGALSVRLRSSDNEPLVILDPGQTAGECSLVDHRPASASVVAEAESRVLVLDEALLWLLVNSSHAVSSNLLFLLVRRLRYGNDVIAEQQARLEQYKFHATVDALTGLFNRRWLNAMLPRQMQRSLHCGEPLSLLMVDVDHFKDYNDHHGHVAGDRALALVGSRIRDHLRPGDMAARYGGEEFVAILPSCNGGHGEIVAERLRRAAAASYLAEDGAQPIPSVTVSLGVAQLEPGQTPEQFIAASDAALYRAKRSGRDRISS